MNGLSEKDINNPERVTKIELVLEDIKCIESLKMFVNI